MLIIIYGLLMAVVIQKYFLDVETAYSYGGRGYLPLSADRMPMNVKLFRQGDPKWAGKPLGTGGFTMASHGCLVTAVAMMLSNYAIDTEPGDLLDRLNAVGGILPDGNMVWTGIERAFPDISFHSRRDTTLESPRFLRELVNVSVERIDLLVRMGQPVLVNVDNIGSDGRPDHWVLVVETRPQWVIHDPATGERLHFSDRYGDPEDGLYGYAIVIGPPAWFPDYALPEHQKMGKALWKADRIRRGIAVETYARELVDTLI